jgi:protein phosphatase-4 regulatory subunit 3
MISINFLLVIIYTYGLAQEIQQQETLSPDFTLPKPSISNLESLEKIFATAVRSMLYRDNLLKQVVETEFLEGFVELLEQCEDMDMIDACFQMSNIVKCICKRIAFHIDFLNNLQLYVLILQEPYFTIFLGMLEYDREYPKTKAYYRDYFTNHVKFKQVGRLRLIEGHTHTR